MTPREKFVGLIKNDILRMDLAELDFGIYRILNHRRRAVEQYLENTLPNRIAASIAKLEGAEVNEEERIFAQLHTFFTRYYEDGDFVMKARRGRNSAYSVPYNGEDVHFHWASKGSHYVKSGLMFEHYRVKLAHGEQIVLAVDHAETPKDNNKSRDKRYFIPAAYVANAAVDAAVHRFTFQWRVLTDAEKNKYAAGKSKTKAVAEVGDEEEITEGRDPQEKILNAWLAGQDFKSARVPVGELDPDQLRPHAQRFVRKHEADFFVHPQLCSFLEGELDYFLKNEFIAIWDNDNAALGREREKFKIAREIGLSLIRFLGEIEDVQAALFEKRRFVTKCDYLVQASAVSAALRQSACENSAQVVEWAQWVGEKIAKPAKATAKHGEALLARYPHLPIHTCHFDDAFTLALLAEFPDLDAATGGTLIHSENYGALRTLEPTYLGQVKCIYIDPPYNTDATKIAYKNEMEQASWLSLMNHRLETGKKLLSLQGVHCLTIDDYELAQIRTVLDEVFGVANWLSTVVIRNNPSGRSTVKGFSVNHEYAIFHANDVAHVALGRMQHSEEQKSRYDSADNVGDYEWENFRKSSAGSDKRDRPKQHFPIAVNLQTLKLRMLNCSWQEATKNYSLQEVPRNGEEFIYPRDESGREKVWRWGLSRTAAGLEELKAIRNGERVEIYGKKYLNAEGVLPRTWWDSSEYSARDSGTRVLRNMLVQGREFDFPKAINAVRDAVKIGLGDTEGITLDFFAGSGTTGHAIISLNREDGGTRKFLLVEMGEYFDTVMLPRIAKVMTSPEWKDGKPKEGVVQEATDDDHWSQRTLPVVKVLRLESYDDALNAIELEKDEADNDASTLIGGDSREADETLIRYVLGAAREENTPQPVWLNTEALDKPFDYALPTVLNGVASTLKVDLTETACLMLGMQAVRIRAAERAPTVKGNSKLFAQRFRLVEGWLTQEGNKLALLVLRDYVAPKNGDEAKAEYEWLKQTVMVLFGHALAEYAKLYYNRDMVFMGNEKFECVDGLLKRRMMERASA